MTLHPREVGLCLPPDWAEHTRAKHMHSRDSQAHWQLQEVTDRHNEQMLNRQRSEETRALYTKLVNKRKWKARLFVAVPVAAVGLIIFAGYVYWSGVCATCI